MTTASRSVTWTVVTWNAHGSAHPPIGPVAGALDALQADVVALQEVRRVQADGIATALGAQHEWTLGHYVPTWPWQIRAHAEGVAILTPHRLRPEAAEVISARRWTWSWRRRVQLTALVEREDHSACRVVNVHLSPGDLAAERRAESARVAARAGRTPSPPTVVAGDLNDAGEPVVVETIEAVGLRDAWSAGGTEPAPTSPSTDPYQTLDHVLVPAAAADVRVDVPPGDWAAWSDHLPVRATFTLAWAAGDFPLPLTRPHLPGFTGICDARPSKESVMPLTRRTFVTAAGSAVGATGLVAAASSPTALAATAGTIVLVAPQRIVDSRVQEPTKYTSGAVDAIAVHGINPYHGVIVNLTVTDTEGSGFVTLGKEPVLPPTTSNINWSGPGITLANLAIVNTGLNAGGIVIQMAGGGAAHLIIDLVAFIA